MLCCNGGFLCRVLLFTVLCVSLLMAAPVLADDDDDDEGDYLPNEVLVKLVQASDLGVIASAYGLDPIPLDQFGSRPIFRLRIVDGTAPPDKAEELSGDSRVEYAEPNFVAETPEGRQRSGWGIGGDSGIYAGQWAPKKIRLKRAHKVSKGKGVIVAVLDTGVDRNHPKLIKKLVPGYDFVDMDADPSEVGTYPQDLAFGHGTHVAGLVALAAPRARIMPVRVLDRNGMGNVWVLAEAIAFAVNPDGNPATDDGARVINMSLSTLQETELLSDLLEELNCDDDDDDDDCPTSDRRGVVVVAAAGNSASTTEEYPAAEGVTGLIAVGASTQDDLLAAFSNHGGWIHVAAPGEHIISTVPGGYGTWSGTSMAAPLVAGQAALVRSRYPKRDAAGVLKRLINTADPIGGAVPLRIDAAASVGRP